MKKHKQKKAQIVQAESNKEKRNTRKKRTVQTPIQIKLYPQTSTSKLRLGGKKTGRKNQMHLGVQRGPLKNTLATDCRTRQDKTKKRKAHKTPAIPTPSPSSDHWGQRMLKRGGGGKCRKKNQDNKKGTATRHFTG